MVKFKELKDPNSCLNKAKDHEPVFVLRAKDLIAPSVVRVWASLAVNVHEESKIKEALKLALEMEEWRKDVFSP